MPSKTTKTVVTTTTTKVSNRHGLHLQWPRRWIIILGIILIFLCFVIAGMEVGHTISDLYRSTAFGGFIVFIPFLICGIVVLITGLKTRPLLVTIAVVLCCLMIILCIALIAYDIMVLIDPTRCFFLNCNNAIVNATNSTTNVTVTGWPLTINWPQYFQNNMNNKRIFEGIQLGAACLFILCCILYLLTYCLYRHMRSDQQSKYVHEHRSATSHEANRVSPVKPKVHDTSRTRLITQNGSESSRSASVKTPIRENNGIVPLTHKHYLPPGYKVQTYTIDGQPSSLSDPSFMRHRSRTFTEPIIYTSENNPLCRRCLNKPRMIFATDYERENFYPHLCINCNTELANIRQNPVSKRKSTVRRWRN